MEKATFDFKQLARLIIGVLHTLAHIRFHGDHLRGIQQASSWAEGRVRCVLTCHRTKRAANETSAGTEWPTTS